MIPKLFHLYWSAPRMPYLRYLTMFTLRHHHPDWRIWLHTASVWGAAGAWAREKQDFQRDDGEDWTLRAYALADRVLPYTAQPQLDPVHQSDFCRWDALRGGGFFLGFDNFILRPFDDLLKHRLVLGTFTHRGCLYVYVCMVGAAAGHDFVEQVRHRLRNAYDKDNYNCTGIPVVTKVLESFRKSGDLDGYYDGGRLFYPAETSDDAARIYDGTLAVPADAYALHWYGGHPRSQEFNENYTPDAAEAGRDLISLNLRRMFGGVPR